MSHLEEHSLQARETLDAARTSLEAAQRAHDQAGDEATADLLRDAQIAYDDASAAYDNATRAEATSADDADRDRQR